MRRNNVILDDLFVWLNGVEINLMGLDQELVLGDIQVIMDLFKDYQVGIWNFQEFLFKMLDIYEYLSSVEVQYMQISEFYGYFIFFCRIFKMICF